MDTAINKNNKWNFSKKIIFRSLLIYFFLYIFPFPDMWHSVISKYYSDLWEPLVIWVANHVFLLPEDLGWPSDFGDSIFVWVKVSIKLMIALIGSIIWTFADRKRDNYDRFSYWIIVYVRYFLAFTIFYYGIQKVFPIQFGGFPNLDDLVSSYGDFSPMGLLWRFMGYSTSYTIFTGIVEVVGGLLLLFRRTTTLGAIILMGALGNVVMLNIGYDVIAKLFSINLLLMAVFLVAIDSKRIISLFLLNKPFSAIEINPPFVKLWMNKAKSVVKLVLIISILYFQNKWVLGYIKSLPEAPPALYGIYNIESFIKNNDTLPPLTTDTTRWSRMIVRRWNGAGVYLMNGSWSSYVFKTDTVTKKIEMFSRKDTINKYFLNYALPDTAHLVMWGKFKDDSIYVKMKKVNIDTFKLVKWRTTWMRKK